MKNTIIGNQWKLFDKSICSDKFRTVKKTNSLLAERKNNAHCTSHSFDLQSPAGQRVPPEWHPCLVGWSPAASGAFPSVLTERYTQKLEINTGSNNQIKVMGW